MADIVSPTAPALDAPSLSLNDYRSLREGRAVPVASDAPPAAAPAAEEAEIAPDSETGDDSEDSTEPKEADERKPKSKKLNARFSELTGQIKDLQRQLAAQRGTGPETPRPAEAPPTPAPAAADVEPDPAQYTDYNAYQKDLVKYEIRQSRKAEAAESQQRAAVGEQQARLTRWNEQIAAAKAAHPDFEQVALHPDLPVSKTMAAAITDSDIGPSILLHLGQNPALALRLSKLSDVAAVREIGKIEAALAVAPAPDRADEAEDEEERDEPPAKKPISQAPKPVRALTGARASSPNPARNIEGMSLAEFRALRESGKIR